MLEIKPTSSREASAFSRRSRIAFTLCFLLTFLLFRPERVVAEENYSIKLGFLYNFTKFISWPDEEFDESFSFCVLGINPFGAALDALDHKTVRGKKIRVLVVRKKSDTNSCHLLFVPARSASELSSDLYGYRRRGLLTVSEVPPDGVIAFELRQGKIRFSIDAEEAERRSLKISSQLLKLGLQ